MTVETELYHIKSDKIGPFAGEYRFLSNFYPSPIKYRGKVWKTVEHAYQAEKFTDKKIRLAIFNADTPAKTKKIARANAAKIKAVWDQIKFGVMYKLLVLKFRDKDMCKKLLATDRKYLVEINTWGDRVFGVCDGVGDNMLGRLEMQVRFEASQRKIK